MQKHSTIIHIVYWSGTVVLIGAYALKSIWSKGKEGLEQNVEYTPVDRRPSKGTYEWTNVISF